MPEISLSQLLATAPADAPTGPEPVETVQGGASRAFTIQQIAQFSRRTPVNNQTGTSYSLVSADAGRLVRQNNESAISTTIPEASSAGFSVGDVVPIRQVGAGPVTVEGAGGVTINVPFGFVATTGRQGATIMLHCVAEDEWDLTGDLAEA